jgi:hypothetical protein
LDIDSVRNRFSGFLVACWETAKAVPRGAAVPGTVLKHGVNENRQSGTDVVVTALWAVECRRATGTWLHLLVVGIVTLSALRAARADIPWPEVVQRLTYENEKLTRRPQGHAGEFFIVCTLYYTPKESGFTFERGFDATRVTKPGLHGRSYPRDFLRSVKKEGYGRIVTPVNGRNYIRYNDGGSYSFSPAPSGGGGTLVARFSAAARTQGALRRGFVLETSGADVERVFGSSHWKIVDTGGGLRRWQLDCYYGEDEPLGPGKFMGRPRGTTFEYAYSMARVSK